MLVRLVACLWYLSIALLLGVNEIARDLTDDPVRWVYAAIAFACVAAG